MASPPTSSPETSPAVPVTKRDQPTEVYKTATIDDVLEELSSRFILNLPEEELASVERICFQVEQAHWFYEDFVRENNPQLPSLALKKFSEMLFRACPLIQHWSADHERAFDNFMQYKIRVPVCGAIMLNSSWDKCVLVKGWKASSGWGFPKGKINEDEAPHKCAVREVLEETGYDLSKQINPDHAIVITIKEQRISLYIVPGVPEDYPFQTKTRKEISKIEWFRLVDLPTWKRNKSVPGKFYLISPFIGPLRNFINEHKPRDLGRRRNGHHQPQHSVGIESGSQSSSAADPHTPSPQQTQALGDPGIVHAESSVPIDPNLARLLTSLSLSATPQLQNGEVKSLSASDSYDSASLASISESNSRPASTAPSSTHGWSPAVNNAQQTPSQRLHDQANMRGFKGQNSQTFPMLDTGTTLAPISTQNPPLTPPTPTSATLSTTSATTTSSTSPFLSRSSLPRRTSHSTADMSPYLPRNAELPASGKRMKQLALLESLADTGAQSMSRAPSVAPMMSGNGHLNGPSTPFLHNGMGPTPHQQPVHTSPSWARTPYEMNPGSNLLGPYPTMTPPPHFSQRPAPSLPVHDDPFQVRPRTSIAMFGPLHAAPVPRNANGVQLLSILQTGSGVGMNGPGALSHPSPLSSQFPGGIPPPQMSESGRVLAPGLHPPPPSGPLGPIPSQLRSMPPQHPPPQSLPLGPSQTAPSNAGIVFPPGFVPSSVSMPDGQMHALPHPPMPPPSRAGNPNLLSILNNPNPGVLAGGMGPR